MVDKGQAQPEDLNLGRRIAEGAIWVAFMRFLIRVLGVISTVILARLLTPADYGLIALAAVLAAAVELLSSFNFEVWLLRHPNPEREHFDTVWTLSIMRGVITALLLLLMAGPMAGFYDDPRLADVIGILALGVLLSSFANVGVINFQRDLRFDRDVYFNASVKIGAFIMTVTLGILLRNYWALAIGIATANLLRLTISYLIHPYRPRLSVFHWREAFGFSKWLLIGNSLGFLCTRSDTFVLGKLAGGQVLGLYNVAKEIADLAATEIVVPIRRVMMPGYAKLQGDLGELRPAFVNGFGVIVLLGVPCAVGLAVVADPLIRVMLGSQWTNAIPIMQVLGVNGVAAIGLANQWPTLIALGRPELASMLLAICVVILLPTLYFAALLYGAVGAALAVGLINVLLCVLGLLVIHRLMRYAWSALWSSVWRTFTATVAMALAVTVLQGMLASRDVPVIVTLVSSVAVGVTAYLLVLYLLVTITKTKHGPEHLSLEFLRRKLPFLKR